MKRLVDEVVALAQGHADPRGVTVKEIMGALGATRADVSAALDLLRSEPFPALVVRYGESRTVFVRPRNLGPCERVCPVCDRLHTVRKPSVPRVTCSKSCGVAFSWRDKGTAEKRSASIRAVLDNDHHRQRMLRTNAKRWSDPKQREALSRRTREMWADPKLRAEQSAAIHAAQMRPEVRQATAERMKQRWASDEGRTKLVQGNRRSKTDPQWRAWFSQRLRERWNDPEMRRKWSEANRKKNEERWARKREDEAKP